MIYEAIAGQTAPLYFYLEVDNAVPKNPDGSALTMAGMSCALVVKDADGEAHTISGPVTAENESTWLVKYDPASNDLVAGRWRMRIQVTAAGKIAYFPSGAWDELVVRNP